MAQREDREGQSEQGTVPPVAVEAAARAMSPRAWGPQVWTFAAHGESPEDARARVQQESLEQARTALEAAAPFILGFAGYDPKCGCSLAACVHKPSLTEDGRRQALRAINLRAVQHEMQTPLNFGGSRG